ncbi:hypothetical protein [Yersinia enterocolitica]|uniref:hypothetical protein n=1 Tax=Yersinia enterocolitica TaxID=630 RepID=UPI003D7B63A4
MTSPAKQEDRGDPISLQEQHAATYYAALTNKDRGIPISLFVQTCAMNQGLSKEEAGTLLGKLAFELGYRQLDKPIYSNTLFSWMRNKTTPLWAAKTAGTIWRVKKYNLPMILIGVPGRERSLIQAEIWIRCRIIMM